MNQIKIDTADRERLIDIRDVKIDGSLPSEEKIQSFVQQIKNPYCFKVGSVVVRVSYAGSKATLNEQFSNMLSTL